MFVLKMDGEVVQLYLADSVCYTHSWHWHVLVLFSVLEEFGDRFKLSLPTLDGCVGLIAFLIPRSEGKLSFSSNWNSYWVASR